MKESSATSPGTDGHRSGSGAASPRPSRERFDRLFDGAIARLWPAIAARVPDRRAAEAHTDALLRELFATLPEDASAALLAAQCDALLQRWLRSLPTAERLESPLTPPSA